MDGGYSRERGTDSGITLHAKRVGFGTVQVRGPLDGIDWEPLTFECPGLTSPKEGYRQRHHTTCQTRWVWEGTSERGPLDGINWEPLTFECPGLTSPRGGTDSSNTVSAMGWEGEKKASSEEDMLPQYQQDGGWGGHEEEEKAIAKDDIDKKWHKVAHRHTNSHALKDFQLRRLVHIRVREEAKPRTEPMVWFRAAPKPEPQNGVWFSPVRVRTEVQNRIFPSLSTPTISSRVRSTDIGRQAQYERYGQTELEMVQDISREDPRKEYEYATFGENKVAGQGKGGEATGLGAGRPGPSVEGNLGS
ncbi:hypothetical protein EI94DRAFT_1706944 [Lactarius quietus]|nr:hypothetical protein EI94DRAFT_1706944 [Lactarius quietus]